MSILNYIEYKDISILKVVNISLKCRILDILMPICTWLASKISLFLFCLCTLFNPNPFVHKMGINCIISLLISTVTAQIIKKCTSRIRPFLSINDLNINKIGIDEYSFPSGHTTAAFAVAVMISMFYPKLSLILLLPCLVGISRIYLGVHYPTDVAAGMILGSFSSIFIYFLF